MQPQSEGPGSIYDLGYQRYTGARLGRRHAISSLYLYTLRGAFGLGRRTSSKVIPIIITVITFIPALIQLGIGAVASGVVEIFKPENYYGFVQVAVALFCAAVAPEIVGRDQRMRTLSLYFSRALRRRDYAFAKAAAFTTALLFLTLVPQAVLFVGNMLAQKDSAQFLADNWSKIPRITASGVLIAALMATLSLAIACQTPRRSYATVAVIALFLVTTPLAAIFIRETGTWGHYAALLSPFELLEGTTLAVFGVTPERDSGVGVADLRPILYPLATFTFIAISTAVVFWRYERISA
jgi:ABC-2 type transport system permease protein